jgi:hypothetical protein
VGLAPPTAHGCPAAAHRVPPHQTGLLQPVDCSGHRGRLTLERVGEDANLDGAAVVQQGRPDANIAWSITASPTSAWPTCRRSPSRAQHGAR